MILFRARVSVLGTAAAAVPFPSFLLLLPPRSRSFLRQLQPVLRFYLLPTPLVWTFHELTDSKRRDRIRPASRFPICPILLPRGTKFLFSSHREKEKTREWWFSQSQQYRSAKGAVFILLILNRGRIFRETNLEFHDQFGLISRQLQHWRGKFFLKRAIRKMSNCVSCWPHGALYVFDA